MISSVPLLRVIAAVALLACASSPASAQEDTEAREVFELGRTAFNEGRFEDALDHFRRSYELSGKAELLFNIGVAADRLRLNQDALRAFEEYLEALPDAANRAEVEGRIRVLRRAIIANPTEAARATPEASEQPIIVVFEEEDTLWTTWWFWTIVGGVVAGGVVAAILLVSLEDPQYITGDDGLVHFTLEAP